MSIEEIMKAVLFGTKTAINFVLAICAVLVGISSTLFVLIKIFDKKEKKNGKRY